MLTIAIAANSLAASVVGKWSGKFQATYTPPTGATVKPEDVKKLNEFLSSVSIIVTIKGDGSYTAITKAPRQPDQASKGSWKLVGKQLTLTPASSAAARETGTLSADGKSLKMSLPKDMSDHGVKGKAIFKRVG